MSEIVLKPKAARKLVLDALVGAGARRDNVEFLADGIIDTELSGLAGHGFYWLQFYCAHLESGKVDIIGDAQKRTFEGRGVCARPSADAEIFYHRLLVATASPRYLGNRERVFWPKRLEHAVHRNAPPSLRNRASGRERPLT